MTMIYDPIPCVKLVQKFLVGNYEPIMGICGKIFMITVICTICKCCSCCELNINFSECLSPLHKHEDPQWKTFWQRFCPGPQTWEDIGAINPNIFCVSPNFVVLRKICFKHMIKTKIFPP